MGVLSRRIIARERIMASQTQGIQQLLSAEKRAAEKVSEARKRKNRRLKQAKEEAQAEIEKYKKEREQQFGEHEAKFVGSKDDVMKKINADTQLKTEQMNKSVDANKHPSSTTSSGSPATSSRKSTSTSGPMRRPKKVFLRFYREVSLHDVISPSKGSSRRS